MENRNPSISEPRHHHRRKPTNKARRRKSNNGIEKKSFSNSIRNLSTLSSSSKLWKEDTCLSQDFTNAKANYAHYPYRRNTMSHNPFTQLESIVQDAELHRT